MAWCTAGQPITTLTQSPYTIQTWRMVHGLPENRIRSVLQTRDGYIWVATYSGLARFNGVDFHVFNPGKVAGLQDGAIRVLFEDAGGVLWLGHQTGGITRYVDGYFESASTPPNWPNLEVDSFAEDREGNLWIMNRAGWLVGLSGGSVDTLHKPPGDYLVNHLHGDTSGQLWVHRWAHDESQMVPLHSDGTDVQRSSQSITFKGSMIACQSRAGGMWVVDTRVRRWHEGRWVEERGALPWEDPGLTALIETSAGDVCLGTYTKGLYIVGGTGPSQVLDKASGLSHNSVSCLTEDREGNLWVGTGGGGLNMLRQRRVQMLNPPDRWRDHPVLCVATNRSGGLWVGTEGAGLYAYERGQWRIYDDRHGIARPDVWSVHEDRHSEVWIATAWQGLLKLQGDRVVPAPGWPEPTWRIYALLEDQRGEIWVGAELGVAHSDSGSWRIIDLDPEVVEERVRSIAQDRRGVIWFGTVGLGLWELADGHITQLDRRHGLTSIDIACLHVDSEQTLWVGTKGGGLFRYRDGSFAAISSPAGLPGDTVMNILEDEEGHFWMGTSRGLIRADRRQLNEFADGRIQSPGFLQLDQTDGLKSLEFEGPSQPNACRTPEGLLCFATGEGLAVINPSQVEFNKLPPPVVLEALVVDNVSFWIAGSAPAARGSDLVGFSPTGEFIIRPGSHRIEFHYAGLSFAAPHRTRFRYRLEGLEEVWTEVGDRSVNYTHIPPGDYTFRVKACNNDGVWNETGAGLSFKLQAFYWQTWWFRSGSLVGAAIVLVASVAALFRRRNRRNLETLERKQALTRERVRIARDIHDDLGTGLTQIALLSRSAHDLIDPHSPVAEDLSEIVNASREMTRALDEIVWAVDPAHDSLEGVANYLGRFSQRFLSGAGIRCRLNIPSRLPDICISADMRHNLFLAFKEALNNIVRHSGAAEVNVTFNIETTCFTICIEDDGKGFDATVAISPEAEFGGHGLVNLRDRLARMGGQAKIENRQPGGVRVRLRLPIVLEDARHR